MCANAPSNGESSSDHAAARTVSARPLWPAALAVVAPYVNPGLALARRGDLAEAERAFRAALRLDPDNANARRNLDRCLALQRHRSRPGLDTSP